MNINEAKNLLKDLQREFEAADLKTVRFSAVYILNNSQSKIIKRDSLFGRFTEFFSAPESEKAKEKNVRRLVAKALVVLNQEREKPEAITQDLAEVRWRIRLEKLIRKENLFAENQVEDLPLNDELGDFQDLHVAAVEEKVKKEQEEIQKHSLLQKNMTPHPHSNLKPEERLEKAIEEFKARTDISGDITESSIATYTKVWYDDENSWRPSREFILDKMVFVQKAKNFQKALQDKYFAVDDKKLNPTQRLEELAKDAQLFENEVRGLKEGESWLFMGSCGQKEVPFDKLFSLLKNLPDTTKKELSKPAQRLLAMEELPDPQAFMDELINRLFKMMDERTDPSKLENDFLRAFLPDSGRRLPGGLQAVLPSRSAAFLEQALQNGPLENIGVSLDMAGKLADRLPESLKNLSTPFFTHLAQLVHDPENAELIELLLQVRDLRGTPYTSHLATILKALLWLPSGSAIEILRLILKASTKEKRAELRKNAEDFAKTHSSEEAKSLNTKLNASLTDIFEKIRSKLPPQVLSYIDPEGYLSFSHFWVECKKEGKNNYTVLIYPSQALLKKHYKDAEKVQWPLEIKRVNSQKLHKDFFYKLLYQTIEPQLNTECTVKGEDFYQGILDYLGAFHPQLGFTDVHLARASEDFVSEMGLVKLMTTPRTLSPALITLKNYFDALAEFCRSIPRVNAVLEIQDAATCRTLEGLIRTGMQEVEKQKKFLSEEQYRSYRATKTEIIQAVHSYKIKHAYNIEASNTDKGFNLADPIFKSIKTAFHSARIDAAYIRVLKPTLVWALGNELGELIDTIADFVGPLPEGEALKPIVQEKSGKKGWLRDSLSESYRQYAIRALKFVLAYLQNLNGTSLASLAFSNKFTINNLLRVYVPKVHAWLWQVFGMLMQKSLQGISYLLLRCIMNPEQLNQMKTFVESWQRTLTRSAETALGKEEISFDLTGVHEESKKPFDPAIRVKLDTHIRKYPENEILFRLTAFKMSSAKDLVKSLADVNKNLTDFQSELKVGNKPHPTKEISSTSLLAQPELVNVNLVNSPLVKESPAKQLVDILFDQGSAWKNDLTVERSSLTEEVETFAEVSSEKSVPYLCSYLLNVIKMLPVPRAGDDAYWDSIPDPRSCMQELDVLAENLSKVSEQVMDAETAGAVTVSMYALLTMMDRLRHRLPEAHLENYSFDYFDFVLWIQKRESKISDPAIIKMMNQILEFYGVSYDRLPSLDDIKHQARVESLHLSSEYNRSALVQTNKKFTLFIDCKDNLEFSSKNEKRYLLERSKDPQVISKLLQSSFNLASLKTLKDSSNEVKISVIKLLTQFRYQGELIRDHIHEVKKTVPQHGEKSEPALEEYVEWFDAIMQAIHEVNWENKYPALNRLLNSFFITQDTSTSTLLDILRCDSADARPFYLLDKAFVVLKKQVLRCKRYLNKNSSDNSASSEYAKLGPDQIWYVKDIIPKTPIDYLPNIFTENSNSSVKYPTESEIVHGETSSVLPFGLQLALSEPSESIIRSVGFFQTEKEQFENPDCSRVFSEILFECGRLSRFALKQKDAADHIVGFFKDIYQFYVDQAKPSVALRVLYLERKACLLIQDARQESTTLLKHFKRRLETIKASLSTNLSDISRWHHLHSLTCENKESELFVSLVISRLLSAKSNVTFQDNDPLVRLRAEVEEKFWNSMPDIQAHFSDPLNVQTTFQSVLKELRIFSPDLTNRLSWTRVGESLVFRSGFYEIDLLSGVIKHSTSNQDIIKYVNGIRSTLQRENIPHENTLIMTDLHRFESPKNGITLTVKEEAKDFVLDVAIDVEGRRFEFFRNNSEAFASQSTWSENTDSANFSILTLPSKKYYEYSVAQNLIFNTESQLVRVDPKRAFESLLSLSRFCPISLMDLYAAKGKNTIEKIVFTPFNLTFVVKWNGDQPRAYCSEMFTDFYISPKQYNQKLNIFGSYLLLENEAGERKVFLPNGQWKSSLLMRFLKEAGPLATPVIALISKFYAEEKSSFSVFEIDSEGKPTSDDPAGVGLLTALYLLNGHTKLAKKTCAVFERLCKRVTLNDATFMALIPLLLLPVDLVDGLIGIRQRMLAAVEENQRAGLRPPVKLDAHVHSLLAINIVTDLATQRRSDLSEFQQWFLFKGYFYHATQAVELFQNRVALPLNIFKENFTAIFETFAISDELKMRFAVLERKFNTKRTLRNRTESLPQKFVDSLGIEQLVDFSGIEVPKFAHSLPKKVAKLFNEVLPKFIAAPSRSLPIKFIAKVMITPNPIANDAFFRDDPMFKRFWDLMTRTLIKLNLDITSLKLESLIEELRADRKEISFNLSKLTAPEFKQSFLIYYEVARAGSSHPKAKELAEFLSLARGGWDKQTQILIEILIAIHNATVPYLYPTIKQFREVVFHRKNVLKSESLEFEKRSPEFVSFFQRLINLMLGLNGFQKVATEGGQWLFNNQVKAAGIGMLPFMNIPLLPSLTAVILDNAASLGQLWWNERISTTPETSAKPVKQLVASNYRYLDKEDEFFDDVMKEIFDQVFILKNRVAEKNDIFEKINIKELSDSYQEYYRFRGKNLQQFELKSEAALWTAYGLLLEKTHHYQKQLLEERNQIVSIFTKGTSKDPEEIFERLKKCFFKGNFSDMLKGLVLETNLLRSLELSFACHLIRCTRVQQMSRALKCLEELANENTDSIQSHNIQMFAEELSAKRNYQFSHLELPLVRRALVFEFESNLEIWKRPIESLEKALLEKNAVIEQSPGTGKNHTFFTLLNAIKADSEKIVLNIFLPSMFAANFRKLSSQSQMFYQEANVVRFNRKAVLSTENLTALLAIFQRSLEFGETISMTMKDLEAIELMFIVKMNEYIDYGHSNDSMSEEILMQLAQVLQIFRTKCQLIGDEAHELFNYRRQLNYPIGSSHVLPSRDYTMIEACMDAAAPVLQEIRKNHDHALSETDYRISVSTPIAQKMVSHSFFKGLTNEQKQDLIEFFVHPEKSSAQWIRNHPLYREMSMVRGVLSYILFSTLNSILNVGFGPSLNNQGEYARPYEGNVNPLEDCSFVNPHANMVKTFDQFLQNGLNKNQLTKMLSFLKQSIQKETETPKISASSTKIYAHLKEVFADISVDWTKPELIEKAQALRLMRHPKMIILYVRHFVQQQIRFWNESACSNSLDAAEMVESAIVVTATPKNYGTYPSQLVMRRNQGYIGEAIHMIHPKYTGYDEINSTNPREILLEVLKNVTQSENFAVLGDCGPTPLLRGISPEEVARIMINFIKDTQVPNIHGVVFFKKDAEGRNISYYLGKDAKDIVPFDSVTVLPEHRWTYFDDNSGISADIPQKVNARIEVLFGEGTYLDKLIQMINRLRGIKKVKKLVGFSDEMATQTFHLSILKKLKNELASPHERIEFEHFIKRAYHNEATDLEQGNFHAFPQKLHAKDRRARLDKVIQADSLDNMVAYFKEFRSFFVQALEINPVSLYASLRLKRDSKKVCESLREQSYKATETSPGFTQKEKAALRQVRNDIKLHEMKDQVHVYYDGATFKSGPNHDLNQIALIEHDHDIELDLHHQYDEGNLGKPFDEWSWTSDFDPHSENWLYFSAPQDQTITSTVKRKWNTHTPPLYAVKDLLQTSSIALLTDVSDNFDSRIWFSNNYLPTYLNNAQEKKVEIGTELQRQALNIVVQIQDDEVISAGCISIKDASFLRANLDSHQPKDSRKTFVFDVQAKKLIAGPHIDMARLEKAPSFIRAITQLKFLSGSVEYMKDELNYLDQWLEVTGREQMKEVFEQIYYAHKNSSSLLGTEIDALLKKDRSSFERL